MSGVPPSGGLPSSSPPSKGRPEDDKRRKDFKLPGRKGEVPPQPHEKKEKKGLFDLTGEEAAVREKQQDVQQQLKAESAAAKAGQVTAAEAKTQVNQVSQLIQKMVDSMRIGEVNGKTFASMDLKAGKEVPQAFAGSQLTLNYQAGGLTIHFDRFMTPQQENNAITLVEKNKEQLEQMVQALQAKNIQVTELSIGGHQVNLPNIQPLPAPFQPTPAAQTDSQGRERDQQERQGREEEDEGEGR